MDTDYGSSILPIPTRKGTLGRGGNPFLELRKPSDHGSCRLDIAERRYPNFDRGDNPLTKKKVCHDCPSKEMAKEIERLKKLLKEKK